jgi:hypothetical protein
MGPELAILLAGENRIEAALSLAQESPGAALFLMHTGVRALADARLHALVDQGVEVTACAMDAESHGFAPREGGTGFGSQYDHAQLARDARRFVALTPRGAADTRPGNQRPRRVCLRVGCSPQSPEMAQALRSAVAYAALDLAVTIAVELDALGLRDHLDHPPAVLRALGTLRGLGCPVVRAEEAAPGDLEVRW